MSIVTLPDPVGRWTPGRKAAVCEAIRRGEISRTQATAHYALTAEELRQWEAAYARYGRRGVAINARWRIPATRHLQEPPYLSQKPGGVCPSAAGREV